MLQSVLSTYWIHGLKLWCEASEVLFLGFEIHGREELCGIQLSHVL